MDKKLDEDFNKLFGDYERIHNQKEVKTEEVIQLTEKEKEELVLAHEKQKKFLDGKVTSSVSKTNGIQTTILPPIWVNEKGRCVVKRNKVHDLLKEFGYGELRINGDKEGLFIKRGSDHIIEEVNVKKVSEFIYKVYNHKPEKSFLNPNELGVTKSEKNIYDDDGDVIDVEVEYFSKDEVVNGLIDFGWFSEKHSIYLNEYDDQNTPRFMDNRDEVYTFFKNGVVKITKDSVDLVGYDSIKKGYIWRSQIKHKHHVEINDSIIDGKNKGDFEDFVEKCMWVRNKKDEWELDEKEYESLRSVYGYLISSDTLGGQTPCPMFVDKESDGSNADGGNGKSFVMGSIEKWKKTYQLNGRQIKRGSDGIRFLFSGVSLDTKFIFLDDVDSDFDFGLIYNFTTGDIEFERKMLNRLVIKKDIKPKVGLTTNWILPDTNWSTMRRQILVEFGSYWSEEGKKQTPPSHTKHYGKMLIDEFTPEEMNDFYNFGFRCVKEYLRKGIVKNEHSNYRRKQLISQVEGVGVNDGVTNWILDTIEDETIPELFVDPHFNRDKDGLIQGYKCDDFYKEFTNSFDDDVIQKWEQSDFFKGVWKVCKEKKWEYNFPRKGNSPSERRWIVGKKGRDEKGRLYQQPIIWIKKP